MKNNLSKADGNFSSFSIHRNNRKDTHSMISWYISQLNPFYTYSQCLCIWLLKIENSLHLKYAKLPPLRNFSSSVPFGIALCSILDTFSGYLWWSFCGYLNLLFSIYFHYKNFKKNFFFSTTQSSFKEWIFAPKGDKKCTEQVEALHNRVVFESATVWVFGAVSFYYLTFYYYFIVILVCIAKYRRASEHCQAHGAAWEGGSCARLQGE